MLSPSRARKKTLFGQELQDLHRFYLLLFTMFIPVNPVYSKLNIVVEFPQRRRERGDVVSAKNAGSAEQKLEI
jgi:hypothetical protein